ncbi:hypothetical protein LTR84_002391 [Exophiala bonariae]|uniref:DUF2428 domain-containing protein n=1 Tax=Exophiala bonariae TaxID=1690606 RepID=A0AAV9N9P2_9EURO|nr:hypothetical protein LTR84_002391 [Exophiala bonariae]
MSSIAEALVSPPPLSHALLSSLGKGALRDYLRSPELSSVFAAEVVPLCSTLMLTARSPQVIDKHVTAASNALCVFLNEGVSSKTPEFCEFVLSKESWLEALQCVHKAFDDGKNKPAFQLLETLCSLLPRITGDLIVELLTRSALPLLTALILASPRSDVKKSCLMLSSLVRKTPIKSLLSMLTEQIVEDNKSKWNQCLSFHNISTEDLLSLGPESMVSFFFALIFAMIDLDTRTSALKLYSYLCNDQIDDPATSELQSLGEQAIKLFLSRNQATLGDFAENVLPAILGDKKRFLVFVNDYSSSCREDETRMSIFLAALKVGRSKNILSEDEMAGILNQAVSELVASPKSQEDHNRPFEYLLTLRNPELRILAYGLMTISPAANAAVSRGILDSVSFGLKYLHNDADAHERGEILSVTRRFLKRISASHAALSRTPESKRQGEMVEIILKDYRSFALNLYEFLKSELGGHISYQRHILALHSLRCFIDHVVDPGIYKYDIVLFKSLTSLILDPFEDVRSTSASLLKVLKMQSPMTLASIIDDDFIASVSLLAVDTVRGDHADGLGRLWALYDTLDEKVPGVMECYDQGFYSSRLTTLLRLQRECLSKTTTLGSSSRFPIHGSLLSLCYRLQDMKSQATIIPTTFQSTVLDDCVAIWGMVRSILCVDSPETAYEAEDEEGKEGPKDLLAYSWRALRDSRYAFLGSCVVLAYEISLLLQSLLMAVELDSPLHSVIGDICLDQLISLRHRGAFSTVAQTFGICCDRARLSPNEKIRSLNQKWYKVSLSQIDEQGDRLTRRSAGLPAMFSALLSPGDPSFFSSAVLKLISLAQATSAKSLEDEQKLPQVHALNCLKEILTTSRFSAIITQFLNPILELAATSLSSSTWAIRNCGLMLLRACINRLSAKLPEAAVQSGTTRSLSEIRDTPSEIALSLLKKADKETERTAVSEAKSAETLFSALDLLGHTTLPDAKNSIVDKALYQHLSHANWAIRDHAALLLSRRVIIGSLSLLLRSAPGEIGSDMSQNTAHGILLCFRYILKAAANYLQRDELDNALAELTELTNIFQSAHQSSPYIHAAIFDILNDAAALVLEHQWPSDALMAIPTAKIALESQRNSLHAPYLDQRLLLFRVYTLLITKASPGSDLKDSSLVRDLVSSSDCLSYVMEVLSHKSFWSKVPHGVKFLAYLTRGLHQDSGVTARVLDTVATCLVDSMDKLDTSSLPEICSILGKSELVEPKTREGVNIGMRLDAYRLFAPKTVKDESQGQTATDFDLWVSMIEFASRDVLDFPTRWSAASALSTCFRLMAQQPALLVAEQVLLRSKMILYNLLNDDDEDVRAEASSAAARLLGHNDPTQHKLGLCTMAARELLMDRIVEEHGRTLTLAESAIVHVMLLRENASEISDLHYSLADIFAVPVASKLKKLLLAKDDLFAEESQNLYIDDVQEIQLWKRGLEGCVDAFTQQQLDLIATWVLEGLQSVVDFLLPSSTATEAKEDAGANGKRVTEDLRDPDGRRATLHPFGPTYDADFLVVFMKVISIAGVICPRLSRAEQEQVLVGLWQARQICRDRQADEMFTKAVKEALETSR